MFHPDAVPGDQIFEAQEIVDARELWLRRADGETVCVLASARPILDKNGSRRGTRGVCRDFTADRLRENDLARMKTREQVIAYIVDAVRNEADPLDMLSTAATSIGKAMSDTACAVFQREETGELSLIARFGALPDETGLAQSVASLCTDVTAHETHVEGQHQLMTATHYRGDMNGAILLSRKRQSSWSAHDRSLLNASLFELNQSLFSAVGSASAARTQQVAAVARTGGPSRAEVNPDQARLDARAREAVRAVQGFTKLKVKQDRAVSTIEKAVERLTEMKNILLEARELIVNAQQAGTTPEALRDLANSFDQKLGKLNLRAKGAGNFGVNLIGASIRDIFEANDLELLVRPTRW